MTPARRAKNSRLWGMVKHLPGGEETLRDLVAQLHQEDGTAKELLGEEDYTSTRRLTDGQFNRLLRAVEQRTKRKKHRHCLEGNVVWLISAGESKYINWMARALGWSTEALEQFMSRQVKGRKLRTHEQASAVIEPMERLLAERGYQLQELKGNKWWSKPEEERAS